MELREEIIRSNFHGKEETIMLKMLESLKTNEAKMEGSADNEEVLLQESVNTGKNLYGVRIPLAAYVVGLNFVVDLTAVIVGAFELVGISGRISDNPAVASIGVGAWAEALGTVTIATGGYADGFLYVTYKKAII